MSSFSHSRVVILRWRNLDQVLRAFKGIRIRQNCCHFAGDKTVEGGGLAGEGSDLNPEVVGGETMKEKFSVLNWLEILNNKKDDNAFMLLL